MNDETFPRRFSKAVCDPVPTSGSSSRAMVGAGDEIGSWKA